MRTQNPPPGSPPFEPDRPTVQENASIQTHSIGPVANPSFYPSGFPAIDHAGLESFEPTSMLHLPAYAQSLHFTAGELNDAEAANEEGNDGSDMVDAEEGGAPLYDMDMEGMGDQLATLPPEGAVPVSDVANGHVSNVVPPAFTPIIAGPSSDLTVSNPSSVLEQDIDEQDDPDPDPSELGAHPPFLTNANPGILMPDNYNTYDFLRSWRWRRRQNQLKDIKDAPRNEISITDIKRPRIAYEDLKGDEYDLQGIDWKHLGVTRSSARKCRAATFRNYTNKPDSDAWNPSIPDRLLPRHENYFRFRTMDLRTDVRLLHFQLRNIMGCASRTAVYYPSVSGAVRVLDPTTGHVETAMRFKNRDDASVSTLAAEEGMLVTGSFFGTYRYRRLETNDESCCHDGRLTDHISGITNHVQVNSSRRSSTPVATFASNDYGFRMVDMARNETILDRVYEYAINCTALSPDKRLRVMVGDLQNVLITEAETGEVLKSLEGHRDFGFACDWAPDGWTIATGNQDRSIRIWDARKWNNSQGKSISVSEIRCEMAGVRSLRFSPLGSGKRLLLAAEEADTINIIDAQTFNSKQTVDVFGELAGVAFTSAGQEIVALSSDPIRGGVLCLERCDHGVADTFNYTPRQCLQGCERPSGYDWLPMPQQVADRPASRVTLTQRQRQAAMAEDWFF
ncbi:putative WD domain-containing protein [Rosellinia necatrix]|uniref:Putative WD domain-containing protein n=1 Tax=Rosellinia necatrix TaxID=77044 RepID=A0A1S7UJM0_ROSNE|nr:putative WD domain-containing protein [Rosellinia necatrix]